MNTDTTWSGLAASRCLFIFRFLVHVLIGWIVDLDL